MVANKKPIDDIALIPSVAKALVLAGKLLRSLYTFKVGCLCIILDVRTGGIIYSYTLPTFDPIPTNSIQPIRGVSSFALDEDDARKDHYAPPRPPPTNSAPWVSSGQAKTMDVVSLYVFREQKISPYTLSQRMTPAKVSLHSQPVVDEPYRALLSCIVRGPGT